MQKCTIVRDKFKKIISTLNRVKKKWKKCVEFFNLHFFPYFVEINHPPSFVIRENDEFPPKPLLNCRRMITIWKISRARWFNKPARRVDRFNNANFRDSTRASFSAASRLIYTVGDLRDNARAHLSPNSRGIWLDQ